MNDKTGREALREAAFRSEMGRRAAVGSLRNVRRAMGALIQVMLYAGYTSANNEHLRTAVGANLASISAAEQDDDDFRAALATPSPDPEPPLSEAVAMARADGADIEPGWDGLSEAMEVVSLSAEVDDIIAHHRPLIEAALRASVEPTPLDVEALHAAYVACDVEFMRTDETTREFVARIAAEYAAIIAAKASS